jgi:hypothetical protein
MLLTRRNQLVDALGFDIGRLLDDHVFARRRRLYAHCRVHTRRRGDIDHYHLVIGQQFGVIAIGATAVFFGRSL